jgi:hypothetical protein
MVCRQAWELAVGFGCWVIWDRPAIDPQVISCGDEMVSRLGWHLRVRFAEFLFDHGDAGRGD